MCLNLPGVCTWRIFLQIILSSEFHNSLLSLLSPSTTHLQNYPSPHILLPIKLYSHHVTFHLISQINRQSSNNALRSVLLQSSPLAKFNNKKPLKATMSSPSPRTSLRNHFLSFFVNSKHPVRGSVFAYI